MNEIVVIAGGSGYIGKALVQHLKKCHYEVRVLSTSGKNGFYFWNPHQNEIDTTVFEGAQHIINLAGANIGSGRWTKKRKQEIMESRIVSTKLLFDSISKLSKKPQTFISSSAIGIYGAVTNEHIYSENNSAGTDFLALVCTRWEQEAQRFNTIGIRTVIIRTSLVLSKEAELYKKLSFLTKLGISSPIGNGKQYMPWIHLNDLCKIFEYSIKNISLSGPYNACSPQHSTNKTFTMALAQSLQKKILLPNIPSCIIKLVMGEMSLLVLNGSRISSDKLEKAGFCFEYIDLLETLKKI